MKIRKFWVVTKPAPRSELSDIFFQATPESLELQFKGGLKGEEVHAFYTDETSAKTAARWLLIQQKESK